jgi:hypothetical protein
MKLIFQLRGEVADLQFRMEQMDAKLNMLLTLCSRSKAQQSAQDPDHSTVIIPDAPILLQPSRSISQHGGHSKDRF